MKMNYLTPLQIVI